MDFSRCGLSGIYYGGSEKKLGILLDGEPYMLKFQKQTAFGMRNNHISEYIGSHIFAELGFVTQNTYLGTYKGKQVVACKDFITTDVQFVPFNDVGESTLDQDKERYQYEYSHIMQMLRDNSKLTNVEETVDLFWKIYVVDALLGNFDRHGGNWGFLKQNGVYRMAPVFDNGSCLFPNLTDEKEMERILLSTEETNKRIYTFPTSQIKLHGRKSSYYDVIHSLAFPECNRALEYVYQHFCLENAVQMIEEIPVITDMQKQFYRHMLSARFDKIIRDSYELLQGG